MPTARRSSDGGGSGSRRSRGENEARAGAGGLRRVDGYVRCFVAGLRCLPRADRAMAAAAGAGARGGRVRHARALAACAALMAMCGVLWPASDAYRAQIERWRRQREAALTADGGWLTVTGLFWLHEGANSFGAASSSASGKDIVLPADPALKDGAFDLHNGKVTMHMDR